MGFLASCGGGGSATQNVVDYFKAAVFGAAQIQTYADVAFSTRPNANGEQYTSDTRKARGEASQGSLTLVLDAWVPPNATSATPMPLLVFVHGGGFNSGGKEDRADDALGYASTGFVTASVNYRLTPNNTDSAERRRTAIVQAADDVMNAIRYLKKNASAYHIDTSRVAVVGTSAGGALALIAAVEPDTLAGTAVDSAYAGVSAKVQAAVSTGATLVDDQFDAGALLTFDATDAPVLMFHANSTDGTTGATWDGNVVPTCNAVNNAKSGNCTSVATPDGGHTVPLGITGKWWSTIQPFLWNMLLLGSR
jgi:acetyl esterase/lipase